MEYPHEVPPVLLIVFNRPDLTRQVLGTIRSAKPKRLYVAADGPRSDAEKTKCAEVRNLVEMAIDWPCELQMLLRDLNLGCRFGPSSAMDWFFQHESEGIILEDDCIPSPSFFEYCAELLERYRDNKKIMCINGNNYYSDCTDSYYFSNYPHTWGWATWRRAWELYDGEMRHFSDWVGGGILEKISQVGGFSEYWKRQLNLVFSKSLQAWDYLWLLSCWANGGLSCTPRVNLVSNIGYGPEGTHCLKPNRWANRTRFDLEMPLRHPNEIAVNQEADDCISVAMFNVDKYAPPIKLRGRNRYAHLRQQRARRLAIVKKCLAQNSL